MRNSSGSDPGRTTPVEPWPQDRLDAGKLLLQVHPGLLRQGGGDQHKAGAGWSCLPQRGHLQTTIPSDSTSPCMLSDRLFIVLPIEPRTMDESTAHHDPALSLIPSEMPSTLVINFRVFHFYVCRNLMRRL